MNILITNDDGITSDGIVRLARAAARCGTVWVVAPDHQCSAMSHRITLRHSIDVKEVEFPVEGVKAYASSGTPADCIRFGILNIVEGKTDLVLSGINFGYNVGSDTQYSATVGAALEGACVGIPSIALSEDWGDCHEVTDAYLDDILKELIAKPLGINQIWNVNFPGCHINELKGIQRDRKVAENAIYIDRYDEEVLEDGTRRLTVNGVQHSNAGEGTDFRAVIDYYISIGIVHNIQ